MKIKPIIILLCILFAVNSHALCQDSTNVKKNKYEFKIELPKYTYKMYEPVIVNIQLINHDSIPLELWGNFEPPYYYPEAEITDEYGKGYGVYNSHNANIDVNFKTPTNIIQPGDTLFVTMPINDWGKKVRWVSPKDNDDYFGNNGYFEKGKYTANITASFNFKMNDPDSFKYENVFQLYTFDEVKSNYVYFQVIEINDTDKEILKLFKEADFLYNIKPYKDVIDLFPENALTEHVYAYYLGGKYLNHFRNKNYKYINDLDNDYQNFIFKYPNSLYLLDSWAVKPYIYRYFIDINTNELKDDFEQLYSDFISQNKYNMLKYFLKNKRRVKMILGIE